MHGEPFGEVCARHSQPGAPRVKAAAGRPALHGGRGLGKTRPQHRSAGGRRRRSRPRCGRPPRPAGLLGRLAGRSHCHSQSPRRRNRTSQGGGWRHGSARRGQPRRPLVLIVQFSSGWPGRRVTFRGGICGKRPTVPAAFKTIPGHLTLPPVSPERRARSGRDPCAPFARRVAFRRRLHGPGDRSAGGDRSGRGAATPRAGRGPLRPLRPLVTVARDRPASAPDVDDPEQVTSRKRPGAHVARLRRGFRSVRRHGPRPPGFGARGRAPGGAGASLPPGPDALPASATGDGPSRRAPRQARPPPRLHAMPSP